MSKCDFVLGNFLQIVYFQLLSLYYLWLNVLNVKWLNTVFVIHLYVLLKWGS